MPPWAHTNTNVASYHDAGDSEPAVVGRYLSFIPLLWVLGLNIILVAPLTLRMIWRRWPLERRANLVFLSWCCVAGAQAISATYNWALLDEPLAALPGRLLSFGITGWVFLGLGICAGRAWQLDDPRVVRGVMAVGVYIIIGTIAAFALAFGTGLQGLEFPTPVRLLLGSGLTFDFYTTARLYLPDPASFGLPRLVLFYPWSTVLGFAGICICLIATCETSSGWRRLGGLGGLVAIAMSFSRASVVVFPLALLIFAFVRLRPSVILFAVALACLLTLTCLLTGSAPLTAINDMLGLLKNSRAGSSQARDIIYEYSWQGFLDAPWVGHGWTGESILRQEMLPIGTHSTFYGTLYTGGLLTFATLVIAVLTTLACAAHAAIAGKSREAAAATAMIAAAIMISYGESFYNIVLPCQFVFWFVGGSLSPRAVRCVVR